MTEALWILDTSVVVGWFFTDEPSRERSLTVREDVCERPHRYVVPPLFHAELVHVLARKSGRDRKFTAEALALVLRLGLRTVTLSEEALVRTAHWACRGMSGYEATFVALAEDLGGRWLSADAKAVRSAGSSRARTLNGWRRG